MGERAPSAVSAAVRRPVDLLSTMVYDRHEGHCFGNTSFGDHDPTPVRDAEGCSRAVEDGIGFPSRIEDGRRFQTQWVDLPLDGVISRLGSWRRIP